MLYKRIKRIISFIFAVFLCFLFAVPSFASSYTETVSAPCACVYNIENSAFVFEKGADISVSPGPSVKLMTAILALEHYGLSGENVTVTKEALSDIYGGAVIGLSEGETISSLDLLYALLVGGASDAANALAVGVAGSVPAFVSMMNKKAKALGAVNTLYGNTTGLDTRGAKTTAGDTAVIAAYACGVYGFTDICSQKFKTLSATDKSPARTVSTRNYLISGSLEKQYYYAEAKGMCAGFTDDAGYCLVSSVTEGSLTYICVLMKGEKAQDGSIPVYYDAKKLLSWASDAFEIRKILSSSEIICEIPVKYGKGRDFVTAVPASDVYAFLPEDAESGEIERRIFLFSETLEAPVKKGAAVGKATLYYKGELTGECDICAKSDVYKNEWLSFISEIEKILGSAQFIITLIIIILIAVFFIFVRFLRNFKKTNR